MSKLVLKLRDQNRRKTVKKFAAKRAQLKALINDQKLSPEDRYEARLKLQKLPRDASPVRLRNRCALTGRPRGVYSKFGLGRSKLRDIAMRGELRVTGQTRRDTADECGVSRMRAMHFPIAGDERFAHDQAPAAATTSASELASDSASR